MKNAIIDETGMKLNCHEKFSFGLSSPIKKGGKNMSFVGVHVYIDGIIAFSDSKPTINHENGSVQMDKARGNVDKCFSNSKFVFATFGNNELFSMKNKKNIEEYIEKNIGEKSYKDFFGELAYRIYEDKPEYNTGIYYFIIGSRDIDGYFSIRCTIDSAIPYPEYSEKKYGCYSSFGGADKYCRMYELIPNYLSLSIEENEKRIRETIEKMIELYDVQLEYNSVGKPVKTIIWK